MSSPTNTASSQPPSKYVGGCPYVGMFSDPQTHVGVPDSRNCCHLLQPPLQIKIGYQQSHCLGGGFPDCPVYKTSGEAPVSMEPFEGEEPGRGMLAGRLFGLRRASKSDQLAAQEEQLAQQQGIPKPDPTIDYYSSDNDYSDSNIGERVQKPRIKTRGLAVLVAVILIVLVGGWWGLTRMRAAAPAASASTDATGNPSLSVALNDLSTAEFAMQTAERVLQAEKLTAAAGLLVTPTPEPTKKQATFPPTFTAVPTVCDNIDLTLVEIISGPQISPVAGTLYKPGSPKPQAVWAIKNASECSWNEILLWSVKENKIIQPIILKQGQLINAGTSETGQPVKPGELIEVALEFNPLLTKKIDNEWVLVINGLSLFGQPRLDLQVDNWLTFPLSPTSTPTTKPRTPRPGGNPTDETPPPRP